MKYGEAGMGLKTTINTTATTATETYFTVVNNIDGCHFYAQSGNYSGCSQREHECKSMINN